MEEGQEKDDKTWREGPPALSNHSGIPGQGLAREVTQTTFPLLLAPSLGLWAESKTYNFSHMGICWGLEFKGYSPP